MMHKEIAQRLRELDETGNWGGVQALADELDPPLPEPGTVVWWRYKYAGGPEYKYIGIVEDHGEGIYDAGGCFRAMQDIEWKLAHVLEPGQVIVDVPPVSEWAVNADYAELRLHYGHGEIPTNVRLGITRAEAERMEAR